MPLVGAALGIEHDDAAVLIAVGDVEFAGRFVDDHVRRAAESAGRVRAGGSAGLADLLEEFSGGSEF